MYSSNEKVCGAIAMAVVTVAVLAGCGLIPRKVAMDDPQVRRLVKVAQSFDRTAYGFSPIPKQATNVRLELRPTGRYNAMLYITTKTVHTIAFRKENGRYVWIGDQETFDGPEKYKTVDGTFHEAITLTYETRKISGYPINQLNVTYRGEDHRLAGRNGLTLVVVNPILRDWGY